MSIYQNKNHNEMSIVFINFIPLPLRISRLCSPHSRPAACGRPPRTAKASAVAGRRSTSSGGPSSESQGEDALPQEYSGYIVDI